MKRKFREIRLSKENKKRLEQVNSIIEEYSLQGYILTLRQLYYQLVSRDIIANLINEYTKLSKILTEGRMGGFVDWESIEDRVRKPSKPSSFDSPKDIIRVAMNQYRKDRMMNQNVCVEVWVEKDALSGVLKRVTEEFGINIMVNRGYSSVTAMFHSFERFEEQIMQMKKVYILYLGDHDPSGIDMIRDVRERILEFLTNSETLKEWFEDYYYDSDGAEVFLRSEFFENFNISDMQDDERFYDMNEFEQHEFNVYRAWVHKVFKVEPIGLTWKQIQTYNPPPNPAKISDPRAEKYIERYGQYSWEVDALKPEILNNLLRTEILGKIDYDKFLEIKNSEETDRATLKRIIKDNFEQNENT